MMEHREVRALMKNLYCAWKFPFILPKIQIGPYFQYKSLPGRDFLRFNVESASRPGSYEALYVQTSTVSLPLGPFRMEDGTPSFGVSREDCEALFDLVKAVEAKAEEAIKICEVPNLPEGRRKQIKEAKGPLVRPLENKNYFRMFFQPSSDCITYEWQGKELYSGEWKAGNYQFILRLNNIYLGDDYPCYLQWKICQIRYFPIEPSTLKPVPFFFHPLNEDDLCATSNYPRRVMPEDFLEQDIEVLLNEEKMMSTPRGNGKKATAPEAPKKANPKKKSRISAMPFPTLE